MGQVKFNLTKYDNFKIESGFIDRNRRNSCYIYLTAWFDWKCDNHKKRLEKRFKKIRQTLSESLDENIFHPDFIAIDSIPYIFPNKGPVFVGIEFTLFTKTEYHESIVIQRLNKMLESLSKHFEDDEEFNVTKKRENIYE